MKAQAGALAIILALALSSAVPVIAQDDHHEHEQANVDHRDESAYYNNPYYREGWNNGLKHERKEYHWKKDEDRDAYNAGYAHGEHGEKWQEHNSHRENDRDDDHQ